MLIVDDEEEIRRGLEAYDWERVGIRVAGSCENGLTACQRLFSEPADILLTDIRMPFMDGFELIHQIVQRFPYMKIVILTGYNDFQYARQGIRYGVSDYLLKPVSRADIDEAFGRIVRELDDKRLIEIRTAALERKAKLSAHFLRQRFLQRLLFQRLSQDEIEEGCSESEMMLEGGRYAVWMLRIDRREEQSRYYSDREWDLILFALGNILTEMWDGVGHGYHWIDRATGRCSLLCAGGGLLDDSEVGTSMKADKAAAIANNLKRFQGLIMSTVSYGIGPVVRDLSQIHLSGRAVADALNANLGKGAALVAPDLSPGQEAEFARTADNGYGIPAREAASAGMIEEAKRFIDANFERSISLQDVAEHIHCNPNYLSSLFRKTTGKNYIHYLTARRMEQAVMLLRHTSFKVYEISEMVGYSTPAYFVDLFRKHNGHTPHEFRSLHGNAGEGEH
ncbi:response regulator transcription factor [Paenibacillus mendelii]|uniref:Response regulator n=1 Tax=Paenibacillus mendelii TaxID=206163 RepID=A0ABV6J2K3_9BACL|nr:response regulator [Paenibacillus mendelii]MCQ6560550.1 response regulator [Paenibacillus mendelii]